MLLLDAALAVMCCATPTPMDQFVTFFTATYIYQGLAWLATALWADTVGRIFLISVIATWLSVSVYSGYLSRFAGGLGGFPFSRLGLQIGDIITLIPASIVTLFSLAFRMLRKLVWWAIGALGYIVVLFLISYILSRLFIGSSFVALLGPSSPIVFVVSIELLVFFLAEGLRKRRWWVVGMIVLQVVSLAVLMASPPSSPVTSPSPVSEAFTTLVYPVSAEFLVGLAIIFAAVLPTMLGQRVAETSLREHMLSTVASLLLRQPYPALEPFVQPVLPARRPPAPWHQRWFAQPVVPVAIEPDVYHYRFVADDELSLVASFADTLALFLKPSPRAPGGLVLVARDSVIAMALHPPRKLP